MAHLAHLAHHLALQQYKTTHRNITEYAVFSLGPLRKEKEKKEKNLVVRKRQSVIIIITDLFYIVLFSVLRQLTVLMSHEILSE